MAHYTKLPVTIEALRFDGIAEEDGALRSIWDDDDGREGVFDAPDWMIEAEASGSIYIARKGDEPRFMVRTLEGALTVSPDDYLIRGVQGELYPCKPDIFEATYRRALPEGAGSEGPESVEDTPSFVIGDTRQPIPSVVFEEALNRIYGPVMPETWQKVASGDILPPWPLPEIVEAIGQEMPLTLLADVVKNTTIEEGSGWVKVHCGAQDRSEALFKLLTAAKIAGEK